MIITPTEGMMVGILALTDDRPALGEAIFSCPNRGGFFVQAVDPKSRTVTHFIELEDSQIIISALGPKVVAGDSPIIAFIGEHSAWGASGTDGRLRDILSAKALISRALRLQIADVIKDEAQKNNLRDQIESSIAATSSIAAKAFEVGYARSALWDAVFKFSERIDEISSADVFVGADVRVVGDNLIPNIGSKLASVLGEDAVQEIIRSFRNSTRRTRQADLFGFEQSPLDSFEQLDPSIGDVIKGISKMGRQEERLSAIMGWVLESPEFGLRLLSHYRDRADFANRAINHLRNHLVHGSDNQTVLLTVARSVPKLVSLSFPINRAMLLYYLASYLGSHQVVASSIRQVLRESRSQALERMRTTIERELNEACGDAVDLRKTQASAGEAS